MPTLIAADSETERFKAGLMAPPGVCLSFKSADSDPWVELYGPGLETLEGCLKPGTLLAGVNIPYDLACAAAEKPELLPTIFAKYERGEIFDVSIAAALHAVEHGHLFKDPKHGGPLRAPGTDGKAGKVGRYSLEICSWIFLGRANAKANNEWVLRYAELKDIPIAEWPEKARQYPIDDAVNTFDNARHLIAQGGMVTRLVKGRTWTHQTHMARAAWATHLATCWGFRTDPEYVAALEAKATSEHEKAIARFTECQLISADGKDNGPEIKRRVIRAYSPGVTELPKCRACNGTGKIGAALVPSTKRPGAMIKGKITNCKACASTGYAIPDSVPRTDGGGIKTDRDTLDESGDEELEEFADSGGFDKIRETYVPWLWQGTKVPINVRSNPVLETGRTSFEGLIQTMPRKGGVRECVIPRKDFWFCSVDYNAQEFVTLGQCALWCPDVGFSRIAEALNAGRDPHIMLAANMKGIDYETFRKLVKIDKDPGAVGLRQGAKPGNFGFGGLMGAAKFVFTQRKQKLFKDAHGNEHGSMCRVVGIEAVTGIKCGTTKIAEWKKRPCPPVCLACVTFSEELRNGWYTTWEEMRAYHKWISRLDGVQEGAATLESLGTGWVRGGLNAMAAANHNFQHLAAMMSKHAAWRASFECYVDTASPLFGSRLVLFAHDELIAEVPQWRAHEASYRLRDIMLEAAKLFAPDVRMGAEPALMERLYKAAEAVHVNDRLVPWRPAHQPAYPAALA